MSTPQSKLKGKRILPNIPAESRVFRKSGVTFNSDTVETSVGGTRTPGRIKADPLSPMNRLSYDETSLRSGNQSYESDEQFDNHRHSVTPRTLTSVLEKVHSKGNISVEVSISHNGESDKENYPTASKARKSLSAECTPLGTPSRYLPVEGSTPIRENVRLQGGEDSSVTVAVRVRPFSTRELSDQNVSKVVSMSGNETKVRSDSGYEHLFLYDFSFSSFDREDPEYVSQENVYTCLAQPLLGKAFEGYNTCLFAYGQTGSGKSYCIMGHGEDVGIIPRFCEELFSRAHFAKEHDKIKIHVEISFFEIYNEKIHDLLASSNHGNSKDKKVKKTTLRVREHPSLGPYVEGLSTFIVTSFEDVEGWITLGNKNRATAATGMNDKSSRSHSVFTILLTQTKTETLEGQLHDHSTTSKINLVDLAGSERQSQAHTSGERLREGANINKSLLTLGKVISQLAEQSNIVNKRKKIFIPYRDSVLTWLLKESLGGNSKTAMIATVSPANHHIEETLSTLRYAQTARSIVNIARVNEDSKAKLIRELRAEIERLRASGLSESDDITSTCLAEISNLKDQLREKEREVEEVTRSWQERLRQSEERKAEEAKQLEKAGVTLKIDNRLPNFVNLNEDPQLSEMLLYNIKEGTTKVGRMGNHSKHDIQLNGALIADNHCVIRNEEASVSITPIADAPTYVNGNLISEPTTLHHGDRVILGGDHYFRFNHPIEVQQMKKIRNGVHTHEIKDFEYANAELMRVQEARLQEARHAAQEEMLEEVEQAKREAELRLADLEKELREETEGKVREAEGTISKLKRQKMILEQEVIAGRKRQQLEAEAAMKASSAQLAERSRIMDMLQEMRNEAAQKLDNLKQRRKGANSSQQTSADRPNVIEVSSGKMDLYKIALQIREANKISQYMKKNTVFSREDYLDGEEVRTVIKVTNSRLNVSTHWSLPKFESKLVQMRDLYQNESESTDDDDNEVFNDPEDQWGKDSVAMSPLEIKNNGKRSVLSPSLRHALLSSVSSINSSIYRQDSYRGERSCGPQVASLCKDVINMTLGGLKSSSLEESIGDQILYSCQTLKLCTSQFLSLPAALETNNNKSSRSDLLQLTCIQLTTAFHRLLGQCHLWTSTHQHLQSAFIHDLLSRLNDQVRGIGGHVIRFMQGCESDIDSLMEDAVTKLSDGVHSVCRLSGELALATDTLIIYFDNSEPSSEKDQGQTEGSAEVCNWFLSGCDVFIDKTLQGALTTLDELETQAQALTGIPQDNSSVREVAQNVEICVVCCKDLLLKCQQLQVELDISNLDQSMSGDDSRPSQGNYSKYQVLFSHVSALVDAVSILLQHAEPAIEGSDQDMKKLFRCAEMVKKCSEQVAEVTGRDHDKFSQKSRSSLSQGQSERSECNSKPELSETQSELLEFVFNDIKSSLDALIGSVQIVVQERSVSIETPRGGKRLLPSQPRRSGSFERKEDD
ncbi:kinesin-like protein KIF14 [Mya arenaria]|uniref:kinesin-like protein KIF14 n=1 Tax=Mya arenaria TaxID=6604 RepID=UPI0022E35E6D|nr:kinesin-like protein KIF14 [Mya arenaria]